MATVYKRGGRSNRGGSYYVQWYDENGKRRTKSARTTDKATAQRIANKLESDAALRREGVIDPAIEAIAKHASSSIEDHLSDYGAKLSAANRDPKHIGSTIRYIRDAMQFGGFNTPGDISADQVNQFAKHLKEKGQSTRTVQAHMTAIMGFTKWLTDNQKLARDPLRSLRKPNPKADPCRERRMLRPEEWQVLKTYTAVGPVRYGMGGKERALLYEVAIQTGLRSGELKRLICDHVECSVDPQYVKCPAKSTKNQKPAKQYIYQDLAARLHEDIAHLDKGALVFRMPHSSNVLRMFRADLDYARQAWFAETEGEDSSTREERDFLAISWRPRTRRGLCSIFIAFGIRAVLG